MTDILVKVFFPMVVASYRYKTGAILTPGRSLFYLPHSFMRLPALQPPRFDIGREVVSGRFLGLWGNPGGGSSPRSLLSYL